MRKRKARSHERQQEPIAKKKKGEKKDKKRKRRNKEVERENMLMYNQLLKAMLPKLEKKSLVRTPVPIQIKAHTIVCLSFV